MMDNDKQACQDFENVAKEFMKKNQLIMGRPHVVDKSKDKMIDTFDIKKWEQPNGHKKK